MTLKTYLRQVLNACGISSERTRGPVCAAESLARKLTIGAALDNAFEAHAGNGSLKGRDATLVDGLFAVQLSENPDDQVMRTAESVLRRWGHADIRVRALQGHPVLKDQRTGLLHDLECYAGAANKRSLPLWRRATALKVVSPPEKALAANEAANTAAVAWVRQRVELLGRPYPSVKPSVTARNGRKEYC